MDTPRYPPSPAELAALGERVFRLRPHGRVSKECARPLVSRGGPHGRGALLHQHHLCPPGPCGCTCHLMRDVDALHGKGATA